MEKIDPYYLEVAIEFIDTLHDHGYITKEVKREDMRKLDELLGFLFQSRASMAVRSNELLRRIKDKKEIQ